MVLQCRKDRWGHMITDSEPHSELSVGLFWGSVSLRGILRGFSCSGSLHLFIIVPGFRAEKGAERLWSDMLTSQLCVRDFAVCPQSMFPSFLQGFTLGSRRAACIRWMEPGSAP